jgi:chemotaxis protein CheD
MGPTAIKVRIAEFKVAPAPALLKSFGLGSCVGVTLYDPELRIGGLAHILLPAWGQGKPPEAGKEGEAALPKNPLKYADLALEAMHRHLLERGCAAERLQAKIAGGANMFSFLFSEAPTAAKPTIGERNVRAVRDQLKRLGISLQAEDVGGEEGRTLELDTSTGALRVTTTRGGSRVL